VQFIGGELRQHPLTEATQERDRGDRDEGLVLDRTLLVGVDGRHRYVRDAHLRDIQPDEQVVWILVIVRK